MSKRHACSLCDRTYSRKFDMKRHAQNVHPDMKDDGYETEDSNAGEEASEDDFSEPPSKKQRVVESSDESETSDSESEGEDASSKLETPDMNEPEDNLAYQEWTYSRKFDMKRHAQNVHPDMKDDGYETEDSNAGEEASEDDFSEPPSKKQRVVESSDESETSDSESEGEDASSKLETPDMNEPEDNLAYQECSGRDQERENLIRLMQIVKLCPSTSFTVK
eukprot:XP_011665040.1 PREDICTED: acidic leucine-rich nuclear phosphoprotein 32-related protein 1-like [Strongylocentrotus purpuratus]